MKKILLTVLAAAGLAMGAVAQTTEAVPATATETKKDAGKVGVISFKEVVHDFGKLPYDGNGQVTFEFKNKGKAPLVLTRVQTSCGCTTPEDWPRTPIKPGDKGKITIKYDTKRQGTFEKTITVYSTAENNEVMLKIKGEILPNNK